MQISNAASSPTLTQAGQTGATAGNTPDVPASQDSTHAVARNTPSGPTQDEAVSISPAGSAALAEDSRNSTADASAEQANASQGSNTLHRAIPRTTDAETADAAEADDDAEVNPETDVETSADTDANAAADAESTGGASGSASANDSDDDSDSTSDADISPLKSFAYGTLGLERPDQTQQETNSFYTAGRWLAAGITIGGLISLFA